MMFYFPNVLRSALSSEDPHQHRWYSERPSAFFSYNQDSRILKFGTETWEDDDWWTFEGQIKAEFVYDDEEDLQFQVVTKAQACIEQISEAFQERFASLDLSSVAANCKAYLRPLIGQLADLDESKYKIFEGPLFSVDLLPKPFSQDDPELMLCFEELPHEGSVYLIISVPPEDLDHIMDVLVQARWRGLDFLRG